METFIVKLAAAVVPLITLIGIIVFMEGSKRAAVHGHGRRNRAAATRAYAVAATHKWL
jgi:hypothetical protein